MDKNSNPMVSIEREDNIRLLKLWEFKTYNKTEEVVVGHTNVEVLIQEIVITEISKTSNFLQSEKLLTFDYLLNLIKI